MPKSKRARIVHTSQVQKKPSKERSQTLYAAVQNAIDEYKHIFVFSVDNMRNTYLKNIRQEFADSRMFFGKTKVMSKAIGATEEDEHAPGLRKLNKYLKGNVGLLCTNQKPEDIIKYFDEYVQMDFARAGSIATETIVVPEGVVYSTAGRQPVEEDVPIAHSLEATVRKWGMPTRLEKGKVTLSAPHTLCKEGKIMDSNQTALLKIFGIAIAEFRLKLLVYWSAGSDEVTELAAAPTSTNEMDTDDDDEE